LDRIDLQGLLGAVAALLGRLHDAVAVVWALVGEDSSKPALGDPWAYFAQVLGWDAAHVAGSELSPEEGAAFVSLIEAQRRAIETVELEARSAEMEARLRAIENAKIGRSDS
jgi:hypothetical protein